MRLNALNHNVLERSFKICKKISLNFKTQENVGFYAVILGFVLNPRKCAFYAFFMQNGTCMCVSKRFFLLRINTRFIKRFFRLG